jgi:hypothetical protein
MGRTNEPDMFDVEPSSEEANDDVPRPKPSDSPIRLFSFVPRLGAQLAGSRNYDNECTGSYCSTGMVTNSESDLSMAVAVSFDFLFKVGELFRLGPGLMYTHTMDAQRSGESSHEWGNLADFDFVAEVIPRVSSSVWLVPRAQMGLTAFNASGTTESNENSVQALCDASTASSSSGSAFSASGCSGIKSPHLGYNVGLGFGVMFGTGSRVRFRVDGLLNYYSIGLGEVTYTVPNATGVNDTAHMATAASGTRYLLLAGIEI